MNKPALLQSVKNTNHRKPDGTGIRNLVNATETGAKPVRVRCHQKHTAACKSPTGGKRKLPYEEIQRLREQGLTHVAIAQQLGLKGDGVNRVLRGMGLGAGWHTHKREILADGKVLCYVCGESKEASEFSNGYSYCQSCRYAKMAMRSNQDLDHAIHIRNLWFHARAKRLGIYYDLTDEQVTELFVGLDGRCAYCREPMVLLRALN